MVRSITPDDCVKYPTLKDELKAFNEKVKEHIGALLRWESHPSDRGR
jgi:hypothetical protein